MFTDMNNAYKDETNIEPSRPSRRRPLERMMDEKTVKDPGVIPPNSPKLLSSERGRSRALEDDAEISSDEDENDDSSENPFIPKSSSPGTSSEKLHYFGSPGHKSCSKSPSPEIRRRTVETRETKEIHRKTNTESRTNKISQQNKSATSHSSKSKRHFLSACKWCCVIGLVLGTYVLLRMIPSASSSIESSSQHRFEKFVKDLRNIENKFPQQNQRSWSEIQAGMKDVINSSSKPWTFVLFSDESETISCLAELLGTASSKALQSEKSLVLKPEDMGDEYGETIDRLRPDIREKKAVVVHNLLEIDPGAIQAFHTMCDRENPLVSGVVYILTIIAPGYTSSQRPEAFVENTLTKKFINKVHEDKLQPLITRITDGPIIPVVPENIPNGCFT